MIAFHVGPGYGLGGCCLSAEKRPRRPGVGCRGRLLSIRTVTPLQYGFLRSGRLPAVRSNRLPGAGDIYLRRSGDDEVFLPGQSTGIR